MLAPEGNAGAQPMFHTPRSNVADHVRARVHYTLWGISITNFTKFARGEGSETWFEHFARCLLCSFLRQRLWLRRRSESRSWILITAPYEPPCRPTLAPIRTWGKAFHFSLSKSSFKTTNTPLLTATQWRRY